MTAWCFFRRILSLRKECYRAPLQVNRLPGQKWKEYKCLHVSSLCRSDIVAKKEVRPNGLNPKKNVGVVEIWDGMTVKELADALKCNSEYIISHIESKWAQKMKVDSFIGSAEVIKKVVLDLGGESVVMKKKTKNKKVFVRQPPPKPENLVKRPPVVTIMGHVDHGKTTLLDALRNTSVVSEEFGGITQHIGAFSVQVKSGEKVTFIDTPGHAAFTAMRSRGAEVTDFVVLVIAADDGIMEQTVESIKIINRAHVPMIVAVNKIDKPTAMKIEGIKEKLLEEGVQVEDFGGDIQLVPISALKKINLDLLIDTILLEAEVLNLRGDPKGLVEGVVIESKIDKLGMAATVIIKRGTLKKRKILIAGTSFARVRIMLDENKRAYEEASLSSPVQVFGWKKLPAAGEEVFEVESEKEAMRIIKHRERELIAIKQEEDQKMIEKKLELFQKQHHEEKEKLESCANYQEKKRLWYELNLQKIKAADEENEGVNANLIIKGDVYGTIGVISDVLATYTHDEECRLSIVNIDVGNVTLNDIELAETFNAIIYAFNVDIQPDIKELVKDKRIDVRFHNVLYKFIDDLKSELNSRIPPLDAEETLGEAEVLQHFAISVKNKKIPVAGCVCTSGQLKRESLYKILREDDIIFEGKLISMKHHKNEVKVIQKSTQCGLMFDSFSGEFKPGDVIVCYEMIKVPRKTSWDPGF